MISNELVLKILSFIDDNLYTQLTMKDLVAQFHFHKDYIMRVFKREIGITIIEYINRKRIYQSLFSYSNFDFSITKISLTYGFSSLEYYSEIFKKIIGVSPKKYQSYVKWGKSISLDKINIIRDNIASLNQFFSFIEHYRKQICPSDNHFILSIFK